MKLNLVYNPWNQQWTQDMVQGDAHLRSHSSLQCSSQSLTSGCQAAGAPAL